jgi:hypothetical protein
VTLLCAAAAAAVSVCAGRTARAVAPEQFLSGNDFAIAIDAISNYYIDNTGTGGTFSMYPGGEPPVGATDGSVDSKYLNFGRQGAGFIANVGSPSTVQSFQLFTANDAPGRDPVQYVLLGTNAPIVSADRSNGLGETWTVIQQGTMTPPTTGGPDPLNPSRKAPYTPTNVTNSTAYNAYKLYFPQIAGPVAGQNSMQISEVQFYSSPNAGGTTILNPLTDVRAIDNPQAESSYNTAEGPRFALDQNADTKYLNLLNGASGSDNNHGAGMIVTPKRGPSIVHSFQITTGNDAETRDPTGYTIYGTNDAIVSTEHGDGNGGENWTQIGTGTMTLPAARKALGDVIPLTNSTSYNSYKIVFTGTKSSSNMQIADIAFVGDLTGATEWMTNASGNWLNGQNWFGPTPNGVDDTARFLDKSTSAHTVVADSAVTVGTLRMENASTYLLTGAGNLTMQVSTGAASINASGATQEINLPLTIASNTTINVAAGGTLKISDPVTINSGKTVTQTGAGAVVYESSVTVLSGGGLALQTAPQQMAGLNLGEDSSATLSFGGSRAMHVDSLSLHPAATLDVKDNGLIVGSAAHAASADQIRSLIASGRAGGTWTGKGITSSAAAADATAEHKTAVGYGDASALGISSFLGQSVEDGAVVVRHTYIGDANLDGKVDTLDFNSLAGNFGGSAKVWTQSDFNYDGVVDTLDFNALASNFGQSLPAGSANIGGLVPEPSSAVCAIAAAAGMLLTRRHRRS